MTEEELLQEAKDLVSDLHSLPLYQRYIRLRDTLEKDERLNHLKKERKSLQAQMKYLSGGKKIFALNQAKALQEEYDNDPLVINYHTVRADLVNLLSQLTETGF